MYLVAVYCSSFGVCICWWLLCYVVIWACPDYISTTTSADVVTSCMFQTFVTQRRLTQSESCVLQPSDVIQFGHHILYCFFFLLFYSSLHAIHRTHEVWRENKHPRANFEPGRCNLQHRRSSKTAFFGTKTTDTIRSPPIQPTRNWLYQKSRYRREGKTLQNDVLFVVRMMCFSWIRAITVWSVAITDIKFVQN